MNITQARLLIAAITFIWGVEFVLVDEALADIPPHAFNAWRFFIAALVLAPIAIKEWRSKIEWRLSIGLGTLMFLGFATQTAALVYTTVANVGFITGLNVPLVPILALVLFRQKASGYDWVAVLTASAGLWALTSSGDSQFGLGAFLSLVCAIMFAAHILYTDRLDGSAPVFKLAFVQLIWVAFLSVVASLTLEQDAIVRFPTSDKVWLAIIIAAVLGSAVALWAQIYTQRTLSPIDIALLFALEPVFTWFASLIIQGEQLRIVEAIGATAIVSAMIVGALGNHFLGRRYTDIDR